MSEGSGRPGGAQLKQFHHAQGAARPPRFLAHARNDSSPYRRQSIALLVFLALLLASSCTTMQFVEVQDVDTLFFGTTYQGGVVSDAEWRAFVDEVVTPRFPGFTEWTATGHWQGEREYTHVVEIAHLHRIENDEKIRQIIDDYKSRFHQQSVFLVRQQGLAEAR